MLKLIFDDNIGFLLLWSRLTMLALSFFHSESTYELVGGGFCLHLLDGVGAQFSNTGCTNPWLILLGKFSLDTVRSSLDWVASCLNCFRAESSSDIGLDGFDVAEERDFFCCVLVEPVVGGIASLDIISFFAPI